MFAERYRCPWSIYFHKKDGKLWSHRTLSSNAVNGVCNWNQCKFIHAQRLEYGRRSISNESRCGWHDSLTIDTSEERIDTYLSLHMLFQLIHSINKPSWAIITLEIYACTSSQENTSRSSVRRNDRRSRGTSAENFNYSSHASSLLSPLSFHKVTHFYYIPHLRYELYSLIRLRSFTTIMWLFNFLTLNS